MNILLSLNSSGFRQGVNDALRQMHQLRQHTATIARQTGQSESQVRQAINETARVREAAAKKHELAAKKDAALLAQNTKALAQAEKVRAKEATARAASRHEMMGRIGSGVGNVATAPFRKGLELASAAARQFKVDLAGAYYHFGPFSMRVGAGAGALIGLAHGLKDVAVNAVSTAAHFEQMEVAFEVMTGSAERAKAVLADIYQFASVTPFEIKDVTRATQQLTAMGFEAETAFQMVKRLGNIAAAMPEGMSENLERVVRALGQMHAKGKVQAEEMTRQLANAGIPAWEALAHRIGVTVPEAMERARLGMVSARDGIMAILDLATSPRFAMMQQRQAQTLIGLWSTLKDNLTLTMRSLGDSIIKGFDLKGATATLTHFLAFLKDQIGGLEPLLIKVGTVFRAVFDVALVVIAKVVEKFTEWTRGLDTSMATLQDLRVTIIGMMKTAALAVVTAAETVGLALLKVKTIAAAVGLAFLAVGAAASAAWGAKAGGPLGGLAALAGWVVITENMRMGLVDFGKAAKDSGTEVRAWANNVRASIGAVLDELAKTPVGRIFFSNRAAIGNFIVEMATGFQALRQESLKTFGPDSPLTKGLTFLLHQKFKLPFNLSTEMMKFKDVIKETRTPMEEFRASMKEIDMLQNNLNQSSKEWAQNSFSVFSTLGGIARLTEAQVALDRARLKAREKLEKDLLGEMKDTPAMEKGSQAAVSTINRWINEQGRGQLDLKQLNEIQNEKLEQIFQKIGEFLKDFAAARKQLGVG